MLKIDYSQKIKEVLKEMPPKARGRFEDVVGKLQVNGLNLGHPFSSDIKASKLSLRELRVTVGNQEWRFFYKFHPERNPVILHGGDKTRENHTRWYKKNIAIAEKVYVDFLKKDFPKLYPKYPEQDLQKEIRENKRKIGASLSR